MDGRKEGEEAVRTFICKMNNFISLLLRSNTNEPMDTDGSRGGFKVPTNQKPYITSNTTGEPMESDKGRGDAASL